MKLLTLILKLFTLIVKHIANQKDLSLTSAEKFNWISNEFHFQQVYEEVILMFFFIDRQSAKKYSRKKKRERERGRDSHSSIDYALIHYILIRDEPDEFFTILKSLRARSLYLVIVRRCVSHICMRRRARPHGATRCHAQIFYFRPGVCAYTYIYTLHCGLPCKIILYALFVAEHGSDKINSSPFSWNFFLDDAKRFDIFN